MKDSLTIRAEGRNFRGTVAVEGTETVLDGEVRNITLHGPRFESGELDYYGHVGVPWRDGGREEVTLRVEDAPGKGGGESSFQAGAQVAPWSERHPTILWGPLRMAVSCLGYLIRRLARPSRPVS